MKDEDETLEVDLGDEDETLELDLDLKDEALEQEKARDKELRGRLEALNRYLVELNSQAEEVEQSIKGTKAKLRLVAKQLQPTRRRG